MFSPTRTAAFLFRFLTVKACHHLDQFIMAFAILMRISAKLWNIEGMSVWVAFLKLFPASLREEMKDPYVVLKKQEHKIKRGTRGFQENVYFVLHTNFLWVNRIKVINSYFFTTVPFICIHVDFDVNVIKSCDKL